MATPLMATRNGKTTLCTSLSIKKLPFQAMLVGLLDYCNVSIIIGST